MLWMCGIDMLPQTKILLLNQQLEPKWWTGKTIWISGATGSWGREFCYQLLQLPITKLIAYCRGEHRAHDLETRLSDTRVRIHLGDIRDSERLRESFAVLPDVVIHTAALKRIDSAGYNPYEFISTNVLGTWNIVQAILYANCNHTVQKAFYVSSDKAFQSETFYGTTKDRKSTRLNSSHLKLSRMPSSA